MKKIILLILLISVYFTYPAYCNEAGKIDYDLIYNNLPILDLVYEYDEDPDELNDYSEYIWSPYPLIRTTMIMSCKTIKLKPGYYLLTPRNRDGYDFVMFKQKGKIVALVPVYEKKLINPEEIYKEPPKPRVHPLKLPYIKTKEVLKHIFKPYLKPPQMPKYALEANYIDGGKYYEIQLYKDQYSYKMLFKVER